MKNHILLVLIILASFSLKAKTVINVHMPGSAGIYAQLQGFNDYVNKNLITLDSAFSNEFDKFTLTAEIDKPKYVFIQLRFIKLNFYIEPNKTYNIRTDKIDFEDPEIYPKSVVGYLTPNFEILESKGNELNNIISIFYRDYNQFIDTNYLKLIRKQNTFELVQVFEAHAESLKDSFNNDYFNSFVDTELIKLNLLSRNFNQEYLIENIFNRENIQLENYPYMEFFTSYWENYLLKYNAYKYSHLDSVVNKRRSYNALHRLVKRDSLMKDSLLTELTILVSIPALYTSRSFDKEAVMDILTDISSKGQNENIKKIAANMKTMLLKNAEGQKATDFNLYGLDGNKYSLSDFNDKYTYILVWTSTCKECYTELRMLKELNADMDDIINFVAISLDAKPQLARTVKETYEIEYDILYYNIDFINNYNIEIIPTAFLIDNEGNFVSKTAPLPTQKFKEYFIKMLNKKKGNLD